MDILFKTNDGIPEGLQTLTQKCNCRSDAQLINKKKFKHNFNIAMPIMTKHLYGIATMNGLSWVVPLLSLTTATWRTAAILNFVKMLIIRTR